MFFIFKIFAIFGKQILRLMGFLGNASGLGLFELIKGSWEEERIRKHQLELAKLNTETKCNKEHFLPATSIKEKRKLASKQDIIERRFKLFFALGVLFWLNFASCWLIYKAYIVYNFVLPAILSEGIFTFLGVEAGTILVFIYNDLRKLKDK